MNCLQNLPRSSAAVPPGIGDHCGGSSRSRSPVVGSVNFRSPKGINDLRGRSSRCRSPVIGSRSLGSGTRRIPVGMNAHTDSTSSNDKSNVDAEEELKSDEYSQDMTKAMGAVLTYRHEMGMNYNFILPDLIVGSCLQTPQDVDKLRKIGVKTIFCLQKNPDLEYFGVDIKSIQEYAKSCDDIKHYRAEIRDFDAFDLRMQLPSVVRTLHKAVNCNNGITYIHCTAGLGRAPAVALAYMFWVQGYPLQEAREILLSKRPCFPKFEAIKSATVDILTGLSKNRIKLMWKGSNCSSVEVSGLDIGWGQKIPLEYDRGQGAWVLDKELPEGKYEYKYIVDGVWTCNEKERMTKPNDDGHVNNYIHVHDNGTSMETRLMRERLMNHDAQLSVEQLRVIRDFLESSTEN